MELEVKKLIYDLDQAIDFIINFTSGKRLADYQGDVLLRSAVERQFEIMGEALNRLKKVDLGTLARISEYQRIISFQNVLVHGYDIISDEIVWDIVKHKLPGLRQEIDAIKRDFGME
jgi:uncharacterized protein with HEPN domain